MDGCRRRFCKREENREMMHIICKHTIYAIRPGLRKEKMRLDTNVAEGTAFDGSTDTDEVGEGEQNAKQYIKAIRKANERTVD